MAIEQPDLRDLLIKAGAIQQGHFDLGNQIHSNAYIKTERIYSGDKAVADAIAKSMVEKFRFRGGDIDVVLSISAIGTFLSKDIRNILLAMPRFDGLRFERARLNQDSKLCVRGGGSRLRSRRILIVEDQIAPTEELYKIIDGVWKASPKSVMLGAVFGPEDDIIRKKAGLDRLEVLIPVYVAPARSCSLCQNGEEITALGQSVTEVYLGPYK